jgi:hypothetical protein
MTESGLSFGVQSKRQAALEQSRQRLALGVLELAQLVNFNLWVT